MLRLLVYCNININIILKIFRQVFSEDKQFLLKINKYNGFKKIIKLLFNRDQNEVKLPGLSMKYLLIFVEILEEGSMIEEIRKSISDIRFFEEYFLVALTSPLIDITKAITKTDKDRSIVIMHFFTFICNICYTSGLIRDNLAAKYDLLLDKFTKFTSNFQFSSILYTNVLESILAFIINLTCNLIAGN
jgi:hypothetical protein